MASKNYAQNLQSRVVSNDFKKCSDNPTDYTYKCLINEYCVKPIIGKQKSNSVAHARTHKEFFRGKYEAGECDVKKMAKVRLEFIQHCTELVTVNSEPFSLLNKSGFLKMNSNTLQSLNIAKCACTAVKEHIKYLSAEIMNEVRKEVSGKFVSLMVDGASKYSRSILGIYVQFMVDFRIVTRAIGMVNLASSHTGKYLASVVRDRMELLDIKTTQLIAITTDNASNMSSMIETMNEKFGEDDNIADNFAGGETESNDTSGEREENFSRHLFSDEKDYEAILLNYLNEMDIEELCTDHAIDELEIRQDLDSTLQEIRDIIGSQTLNIHSIRCAIHTVQLGVLKALDVGEFKTIILLCRGVCKELRKHSNQTELAENGVTFKNPHIDVKTRWNSTHVMVILYFLNFHCVTIITVLYLLTYLLTSIVIHKRCTT